mgnify:CR=1 FL=1
MRINEDKVIAWKKNECRCCGVRDNGSQELEIVIKTRDKMGKETNIFTGRGDSAE